jgi:KDO2-lipid IV(A) lauroyltransferase
MSGLVFWLVRLVHGLPLALLAALGNAVGALAFALIPERRAVARINLARCFPALPAAERERLARAHFRAFCRAFIERGILWWSPRERIAKLVRVEGVEHLERVRSSPVVVLAPHFVGLDMAFTRLSLDHDIAMLHARQKDPRFERLLRHGRARFGRARLYTRQDGVRASLAALREGALYYYLPDLDYGPKYAVFVPFFGVPAATVTGLSFVARETGARIVPCVTTMLPGGAGYVARFYPAWEDFPGSDERRDARRLLAFIEERVREMPEQYYWLHKRFKTRPPGEARFYP